MKYTTANFAMAGGIKTGVLSRITGQLGSTVDKAKNWLRKAQQSKQQLGTAARITDNRGAEAIAKRKYGESLGLAEAQAKSAREKVLRESLANKQQISNAKQTLDKSLQNKAASKSLNKGVAANNYKYAQNLENKDISPLWNKPTANRYGQVQSNKVADSLANQQSLRLRYTKDPRTGKLVGAAYSAPLSLLCDL